jgi:hypothetical protein
MKKTMFPNLTDKFLSLSVIGEDHTLTMDHPRFELQGGRWFVSGRVPEGVTNGDWSEGAVRAVAWDQVNHYLIFDSADHYRKGLERFAKYEKSKRKA